MKYHNGREAEVGDNVRGFAFRPYLGTIESILGETATVSYFDGDEVKQNVTVKIGMLTHADDASIHIAKQEEDARDHFALKRQLAASAKAKA